MFVCVGMLMSRYMIDQLVEVYAKLGALSFSAWYVLLSTRPTPSSNALSAAEDNNVLTTQVLAETSTCLVSLYDWTSKLCCNTHETI